MNEIVVFLSKLASWHKVLPRIIALIISALTLSNKSAA